jgi:galactitol-specific phosphotransferase system IIB component
MVADAGGGTVKTSVIDCAGGAIPGTILRFADESKCFAAVEEDGVLRIYDVEGETDQLQAALQTALRLEITDPERFSGTVSMAFADHDRYLCLLSYNGEFRLYDTSSGECVIRELDPAKDMDGITTASMAGVFSGNGLGYPPCTAQAVMEILRHYNIPLAGKKAVVVGRSMVIGKPVAMMLLKENATVTICHTKTVDMPSVVREADLVVVAAGHAGVINGEFVREGQVVIDVGINVNEEGKLCGDVDFASVEPVVAQLTPVPRGVGSVTTSVLAEHVVSAAEKAAGKE